MKKKISIFFVFLLTALYLLPVFAAVDNSKGLPYNDYEKYRYYVKNISKSDYGTKPSEEITIEIVVRDKKTDIILSQDTIKVKFDGLPLTRLIEQEGELKFQALARFDVELRPANGVTSEKEVESLWEEKYVKPSNMEKTTLFGRPALQSIYDYSADYYVYMNDIKIPNGIVVFKVRISADFSFGMMVGTNTASDFEKSYKSQQLPLFKDLQSQFNSIKISTEKTVNLRDKNKTTAVVSQTENTKASQTSGETSIPVATAIVVIVAGALAAAAGVGAAAGASSGGESSNEEKSDKTYKMAIKKDFKDKIKYNADTVYVYARMIEVSEDGTEIDRPDLTQRINIFSTDPLLEVSTAVMDGSYMGVGVIAGKSAGKDINSEADISFKFTGEGGTFQNNVKFKVIGECYIELENEKVFLLAGSGKSFELGYELINFMNEADEVSVNSMTDDASIELSIGKNAEGKPVIIATDKSEKKPIETFFESFSCEMIAKNEKEQARSVFTAVLCYEGVLPDFLGKDKEIIAYKNTEGVMPITDIAFRLGIWDENPKNLVLSRPEEIEVNFSDEKKTFELIGLENEMNPDKSTSDYLVYSFKAEKSLPNTSPVSGTLSVVYSSEDVTFESATLVKLMPDLLTYEKDREKEYQNCIRIIDTYLPPEFAARKHKELSAGLDKMGLKDLQLFRKTCWEIASRFIMQEKEDYMIASYWYDEAIATAELVVYVGDIALDVALAPFGGPIAGFVVAQVKTALIELISLRIEKGAIGYSEIYELIMKRLEQAAGQADGLIETPGFDKPKALIAWLSCYILYRIMYRWYFDNDDQGNPKGLVEAIENGLMDFAGKGASMLLGEFAKDIAKKRKIDIGSTADKEQKWVNTQVGDATKKGLDTLDTVAESLDKKINEITEALLDFIDRIRNGGVNIY